MATFIAVWRQDSGCDHTIGCGVAVHRFDAVDSAAAVAFVIGELSSPTLGDELVESIEQVDLVEYIGDWRTLMPGIWAAKRRARIAAAKQSADEKERAEYDRLRKKFETAEPEKT